MVDAHVAGDHAEDPGEGMAEAAVAAGVQLVVICGGDGTIMACLDALAGTDVPVALLPLGTGNLLARNLGVPIELDARSRCRPSTVKTAASTSAGSATSRSRSWPASDSTRR